MLNTSAIHRR